MRYALTALILLAAPAQADQIPTVVQAAISEAKDTCKPDPTRIGPGFLTTRDINGDGAPDYVLNYEYVACADGSRVMCGSAGCLTQVFASTDNGYAKVLDENVQGIQFGRAKGRATMRLGLHGTSCGKAGADACGATLYWNGSRFSPAH